MPNCRKIRYRTQLDATRKLVKIHQRADITRTADHTEQRSYWCPNCKGWHLTSRELRRP